MLILAGVAAGGAWWWWRRNHGYVGGTAKATLTFYQCLNNTSWVDPDTRVTWEIADRTVVPDNLGIEWRLPVDADLDQRQLDANLPIGVVTGTVRFDTSDQATFTGPGGGTMPLFRSPPRLDILCENPPRPRTAGASGTGADRRKFDSLLNVTVVADELLDDGSQPLIPATVQAHEGGALVLDVAAPDGLAGLRLPSTSLTVSALSPGRTCPTVSVTVDRTTGGAHPSSVRLICPAG